MREKGVRHDRVRPKSEVIYDRARHKDMLDIVRPHMRKETKYSMFVLGGREVGQVNVFNRNISVWKLQL